VPLEVPTPRLAQRMDGRVGGLGEIGIGIGTLGGVVLLGEAPVVIGVGSRMALRLRSAAGGGVVLDGEGIAIVIVTMITGGYHRLAGTVTHRLPDVVDVVVEGIVGTAEVAGEGRGTRDLVAHRAEILVTTELVVDPDRRRRAMMGVLCRISTQGRLYSNI